MGGRTSRPAPPSVCPLERPCSNWTLCAGQQAHLQQHLEGIRSRRTYNGGALTDGSKAPLPQSLQVLIVHEQHPQALGCDRRLLALVALMQASGSTVSLLYRRHVPAANQSPRTSKLASLLGVRAFDEAELSGGCLRAPPALYRFDGRANHLVRLAEAGWFDLVLMSVWFWNEPQPAFAEIVLPLLRQHAPKEREPYVGLLVDDAHALRAQRLARWETDPAARRSYSDQASSLVPRLLRLYRQADAVMHVSSADQEEERRLFPTMHGLRWQLLRTPLRAMRLGSTAASHPPPSSTVTPARPFPAGGSPYLGFLGNGQTATNHQGVQWFLEHCWPRLRAAEPSLRLRLVGRSPGAHSNSSGVFPCTRSASTASPRCGWAWGTQYAGREAANGIDEIGFLSSEAVEQEALHWRAMIAPIRATTGINTKLLTALEMSIPLVVTPAAAAPLGLSMSTSGTALLPRAQPALLAEDAGDFIAASLRLVRDEPLWMATSRAAAATFARMETHDPASEDMTELLRAASERALSALAVGQRTGHRPHASTLRVKGALPLASPASHCAILDQAAVCSAV